MPTFNYKKVLVIGGSSGIGEALSQRFVKEGIEVIVTGRRKEKLESFVKKNGGSYEVFDITKLDEIPSFADKVFKDHPDVDAVLLNSGIQRGFNFSKPETVDLNMIQEEFTTNYLSYIHLTKAFLPYLMKKDSAGLIYVSSGLALVPLARCPNYCATKAALHQFLISLRLHLKETSVQVLEIFPPSVQTELHDAAVQPDIKDGRNLGMPIDEFTEETWSALKEGNPYGEFPIGTAKDWYGSIEPGRKYELAKMPHAPADV